MSDVPTLALIRDLIGFPTVSKNPNKDLLDYVARYLDRYGVAFEILWNADYSKGNLWATIGPADVPGVILSGHSDVVPAEGQTWTSDPFVMRLDDNRIYGRGACDMKGFIGAVLAAVPDLVTRDLKAPVHIALSYDEEVGCTGVGSLLTRLADLTVKPALCIVGEPTGMQVVVGHKGVGMYEVSVTGKSAHSSRAPEAVNAIEHAADIIAYIKDISRHHADAGPRDHEYDICHSTISVTTINGGTALNIIPGDCTFHFDIRALPDLEMDKIIAQLERYLEAKVIPKMKAICPDSTVVVKPLVEVPALGTDPRHPGVTFVKNLVQRNDHGKVAFGTEASLFSGKAGIVSVVCGPGSMEQGHKADEYLELAQLELCREMIGRLAGELEKSRLPW